jgi:transcriptional regulator
MYTPELFAVTDPQEIDLVLSQVRLGCLVTRDEGGFFCSHLPMLFNAEGRTLTGHVARANPHPSRAGDAEAIMIFQGIDAYVSPNWYPSKVTHGRVVPTWNYEAVHVTGELTWRTDATWLQDQLARLTDRFEQSQAKPWALADAPTDYIEKQLAGVIGVELSIRKVEVKRKLSQNRAPTDRMGVAAGLAGSEAPGDRLVARAMGAPSGS